MAARAFDSLVSDGLLDCTNQDLVHPEMWFTISEAGRRASERSTFDALDDALLQVKPHFPDMREGMHVAARSGTPDAARQAAHSARELLNQVLNAQAPDDEIRRQPWFVPNEDSKTGVTRKDRVRLVLAQRGLVADDAEVVDALLRLVDATYHRLSGRAHDPHGQPARTEVMGLVSDTERVLSILLTGA